MKIIVAHGHYKFMDYCRRNKIPRNKAVYLNSHSRDSYLRISGHLLKREDVIMLDFAKPRLFNMLFRRIMRGEGDIDLEWKDHKRLVEQHLGTVIG